MCGRRWMVGDGWWVAVVVIVVAVVMTVVVVEIEVMTVVAVEIEVLMVMVLVLQSPIFFVAAVFRDSRLRTLCVPLRQVLPILGHFSFAFPANPGRHFLP
jgi:hypothetical protein